MTNERNALSDLFSACWQDEALKNRFLSEPKAVLVEYGIDVPENMDVNVIENSDTCMNITMPPAPSQTPELSDSELSAVAGGTLPSIVDFCPDPNVRAPRGNRGFDNFFMNR